MAGRKIQFWLAGGSVGIVAAGLAFWGTVTSDDDAADVSAGSGAHLVAGWLPEDWEVTVAATPEPLEARDAGAEDGPLHSWAGEAVVYGYASLPDPWDGPLLTVRYRDDVSSEGLYLLPGGGGDEVQVGDRSFDVDEAGDMVLAWTVDAGSEAAVASDRLSRDELVGVLDGLTLEPGIEVDSLPDGYEEIARGPLGATNLGPAGLSGASEGLSLMYSERSGYESDSGTIALNQQPADTTGAAGLIRLRAFDAAWDAAWLEGQASPGAAEAAEQLPDWTSETIEVRGQEAHVLRQESEGSDAFDGNTLSVVQWFEPSVGQVVTVTAVGVDEATVDSFIDGLRPGDDAEIDELLAGYDPQAESEPVCSGGGSATAGAETSAGAESSGSTGSVDESDVPSPDDIEPPEGATVLDQGEAGGTAWQLTLTDEDDGCGTLSLVTSGGTPGSFNLGLGGRLSGPVSQVTVPLGESDAALVGIFGLVSEEAAEVQVDIPEGDSQLLELYDLGDSFAAQVFVAFVPVAESYELVERDSDGEILSEWTAAT